MQNGKVEIQLDRKRYLKFNFNAWCAVHKALDGAALTSIIGDRALLYGGLLADDPQLTLEEAGEFFDKHDRQLISQKIQEAIDSSNSLKSGQDSKSPNVDRLSSGTGTVSSDQPAESD